MSLFVEMFFLVIFEISAFILSRAFVCVFCHCFMLLYVFSFLSNSSMGSSRFAKLGMNFLSCWTDPMRERSRLRVFGGFKLSEESVFYCWGDARLGNFVYEPSYVWSCEITFF